MKPSQLALFVLAIAAIIAAGAPQASAQASGARQGSNGLFGGQSDANARQKLDLTLSTIQGYDSDMVPTVSAPIGLGGPESTGHSTTLVGAGEYSLQVRRVQFRATGTSTMRYLRPLDNGLFSSSRSVMHSAGVGVSARLPKRTSLLVNQTATYSPSYLYNLFPRAAETLPGDAPPAAPDYALNGFETRSYGTATTVTHDFTVRSSLVTTADYQTTDTLGGIVGPSALSSYGIRGRFSRRLGPNTAALGEYVYRNSGFNGLGGVTTGATLTEHGLNVGLDYTRRLSASRRFTFGGLVGSSITIVPEFAVPQSGVSESGVPEPGAPESTVPVSLEADAAEVPGTIDRYYQRMSGQITIGYEFARTWKAGVIYRRGVDYVAGLSEPISADRGTVSLEGLLARRVDVFVSAGYSNGEAAVSQGSTFNTYTGDVRLRYALTRAFAAYVEYLYYFYDSRGSVPIAPGISGLERKGIRTGLMLRVPALRR